MTDVETLAARLRQMADGYEREARAEDNEWPEPDAYCSVAGGDASRETAKQLRLAADQLLALQAQLTEQDAAWKARIRGYEQEADRLLSERVETLKGADRVAREAAQFREALAKVRGHTSYLNPTLELLSGLLQSIERIADAALAEASPAPGEGT
jgi:hypothetical protein